jgi:DNA-binding phage protein
MNKRHREFKTILLEKLKDPTLAAEYLNEALIDPDQQVFLIALKNILEAHNL